MKFRLSSRRCETCPAKGEPARAGSEPGIGMSLGEQGPENWFEIANLKLASAPEVADVLDRLTFAHYAVGSGELLFATYRLGHAGGWGGPEMPRGFRALQLQRFGSRMFWDVAGQRFKSQSR